MIESELELRISIHSLRMEGDLTQMGKMVVDAISIHSLRMEGDLLVEF